MLVSVHIVVCMYNTMDVYVTCNSTLGYQHAYVASNYYIEHGTLDAKYWSLFSVCIL